MTARSTLKVSKFNHVFPVDSQSTLIFNAVTGAFLLLDADAWRLYEHIATRKPLDKTYSSMLDDLEILKFKGMVLENDVNEYTYIAFRHRMVQYGTKSMNIILAPTLNCNFKCSYCFEQKQKKRMTPAVQQKVIEFIEQRLPTTTSLKINWFGGEPLLEKKTIWKMSQTLIALCKKYHCQYSAEIITNGYFMDKETSQNLKRYKVDSVQVTLDGPQYIHDKRRVLRNGNGTFEQILQNIVDAVDIIPQITVRVNIDKENAASVPALLDTLAQRGLKNKILVYFGLVQSDTPACQDISEQTYSVHDFLPLEVSLFRTMVQQGFTLGKKPRPAIGGCSATHINSFIIGPSGDVYKCIKTLGTESEKVGTVFTPLLVNQNQLKWFAWDPLSFQLCHTCTFFPVCMGGCPYETLRKNLKAPAACSEWKNNMEDILRLYYASYTQHQKERVNLKTPRNQPFPLRSQKSKH